MANRFGFFLVGVVAAIFSWAGEFTEASAESHKNRHGRAVSLKVLQERVKACANGKECSSEVTLLGDLRWLEGYVIDPENHDLILVGQVEEGAPPLHLEDFVVALRDAWGFYRWREGNTIYHTDPGCSIDPHPKVLGELQRIGDYLQGHPSGSGSDEALDYWHKVCHMPQQVRVLGIPFNTHFARVMVDADFFMKKLVDGSATLHNTSFKSLSDLHLVGIEGAMKTGTRVGGQFDSMSRFWFHAGKAVLLDDPGMVELQAVPVTLLTEQEHLSKTGEMVGSGHPEALAKQWADSFTTHYAAIAHEHPIYRELENLYRFVAIARAMKLKEAASAAGLEMSGLLRDFQIPETPVASTLPGHSNIRTKHYRQALVNGYATSTVMMPSCGGVNAGVKITEQSLVHDRSKPLMQRTKAVLAARKDASRLYWDF